MARTKTKVHGKEANEGGKDGSKGGEDVGKGGGKGGKDGDQPGDDAKKKLNKLLASIFRILALLKSDFNEIVASSNDLLAKAQTDKGWKWCTGDPLTLEPLRKARSAVEACRGKNNFWMTWASEFDFAKVLRSKFSPELISAEMTPENSNYTQLKTAVTLLKTTIQNLKDAHFAIHGKGLQI